MPRAADGLNDASAAVEAAPTPRRAIALSLVQLATLLLRVAAIVILAAPVAIGLGLLVRWLG